MINTENEAYKSAVEEAKSIVAERGEPEIVLWDDGISIQLFYGTMETPWGETDYDQEYVCDFWEEGSFSSSYIQSEVERFCRDVGLPPLVNYAGMWYDSLCWDEDEDSIDELTDSEKEEKYQEALAKEKAGDYHAADEIYYSLWGYKDCEERHDACLIAIEEAEDRENYGEDD